MRSASPPVLFHSRFFSRRDERLHPRHFKLLRIRAAQKNFGIELQDAEDAAKLDKQPADLRRGALIGRFQPVYFPGQVEQGAETLPEY